MNDKNFSDKAIVGWDFGEGDTITIELDFDKKQLIFVKNKYKEKFIMPIITKGTWNPFVGLKHLNDCVRIEA